MRNLIITGVPRAGTTLLAALVDSLEDAVCLSEPPELWEIGAAARDPAAAAAAFLAAIEVRRARLAAGEAVIDHRLEDGRPPTDYYPEAVEDRPALFEISTAEFDDDSLLGVKHNGIFTAVLPELLGSGIPILAVVRDPVLTIQSWLAHQLPVWHGRLDGAHLWPEYRAAARGDGVERLARVYECFVARYVAHRDRLLALIRYEDLIRDPAMVARLAGRPAAGAVDVAVRAHPGRDTANTSALEVALRAWAPRTLELYPHLVG